MIDRLVEIYGFGLTLVILISLGFSLASLLVSAQYVFNRACKVLNIKICHDLNGFMVMLLVFSSMLPIVAIFQSIDGSNYKNLTIAFAVSAVFSVYYIYKLLGFKLVN